MLNYQTQQLEHNFQRPGTKSQCADTKPAADTELYTQVSLD